MGKRYFIFFLIVIGGILFGRLNCRFQDGHSAVTVISYGAAGQVSGSLHIVKADNTIGLIDCGNFYPEGKGSYDHRLREAAALNNKLPVKAFDVDFVIVTHAHLDHIGRLPLLIRQGFHGTIYATPGTAKLMYHMVRSLVRFSPHPRNWTYSSNTKGKKYITAHWYHCKYQERIRYKRTFRGSLAQLDSKLGIVVSPCKVCGNKERDDVMKWVRVIPFGKSFQPAPGMVARFVSNEHIPGAASILINITHHGKTKTLLFSGDVGKRYSILQKAIHPLPKADFVWFESTYGDTVRKIDEARYRDFYSKVKKELDNNRLVWIPAFALDRTQKVLHTIERFAAQDPTGFNFDIYLTSPLANKINKVYQFEHDKPQYRWFNSDVYHTHFLFPHYTTIFNSKKLERIKGPAVIISTSGMMDKAASEDLLRPLLHRKDVTVFLVGYQDPETPGGQLKDKKRYISWGDHIIKVNASVRFFDFFSAHADMKDASLLLSKQDKRNTEIHLIHGNKKSLSDRQQKLIESGFNNVHISQKGREVIIFE